MRIGRSSLMAPAVALLLTAAAITAVWLLVGRADTSQQAQVKVGTVALSVSDLQSAPFNADHSAGEVDDQVQGQIAADETSISRGLTVRSQVGVPSALLTKGRADLARIEPIVTSVYRLAVHPGGLSAAGIRVPILQGRLRLASEALSGVLGQISRADASRARRARTETKFGAAGAMLLLLAAFAFFYLRSVGARESVERLARQNEALLVVSRDEARTDALTTLGNRRALVSDFGDAVAQPSEGEELLLAMFDLDGFKQYNDTFYHPAGDELLHRFGARLGDAAALHSGVAYRMGGDEFCVLTRCRPEAAERVLRDTAAALEDSGDGWRVGCSQGAVWVPSEAATASQALKLADERMYVHKASRSSAGRQVTDALLQVISEQDASLDKHVELVAKHARAIAQALGQPDHEVRRIYLAAKLHDVGKTAIPAAILDKPGPLDEREWEFMRRHPVIGERIVLAAPALTEAAGLIRSSHERIDGRGYPDGLAGENIPLGSRIIAVCDSYDAMTSDRVYRSALSREAALGELSRHAGTQFDATVVDAFLAYATAHAFSGR